MDSTFLYSNYIPNDAIFGTDCKFVYADCHLLFQRHRNFYECGLFRSMSHISKNEALDIHTFFKNQIK